MPVGVCTYTEHRNTTFLGSHARNVLACVDAEGLEHCRQRCSADTDCSGFGLYVSGGDLGRCCTKRDNLGAAAWPAGVSYTKVPAPGCPFTPSPPPPPPPPPPRPPPIPPAPPSAAVTTRTIFRGNASWPYNKGAMLQPLPGGRLAAACQAGAREAAPGQRVLVAISPDWGRTWPRGWSAPTPEPPALHWGQWEPTLFLAPNGTLWLFWSEGPGATPNLLFCSTADAASGYTRWAPPRLILNASRVPGRGYMYPINRVVVAPGDGAWLLPCDWGCGGPPTGAFTLRSVDGGAAWAADPVLPGIPTSGLCPEPAMAAVNSTSLVAVVRSAGVGFLQSWSHDGGRSWGRAVPSAVDGAASKPALAALPVPPGDGRGGGGNHPLVLAWNVVTRERMALSTSTDGGVHWRYWATIDNGTASPGSQHTSDCYPTVVVAGDALLTAWSTYSGGPRSGVGGGGGGGFADITLATTALPTFPAL